jgi:peroxiredoxin (alkyl hydroperoxide reductase subunit C)
MIPSLIGWNTGVAVTRCLRRCMSEEYFRQPRLTKGLLEKESEMSMRVGSLAPEFKGMSYQAGSFKEISLRDFSGKWVCLFFYPLDFTFVCPTEIRSFAAREADFRELGCQIIACSTDSEYSHKAWFEKDLPEVKYPVLADTSHRISRDYDVLVEDKGIALRGTFLIDPKGTLQFASVNGLGVGRSVDEILRMLQALQTGELCGADWRPGKPTIKV